MKRILVDQGSLIDILYSIVAVSINISKANLKPLNGNLIGFFGNQVPMEGIVKLRITMGTWLLVVSMDVDFLIINALNMAYNTILGRMSLNKVKAIVSISHLLMKFPMPCGIDQV